MSDILGYVVVEWEQGQPNPDNGMGLQDLAGALKLRRMRQGFADGRRRGDRFTVHAVMAEEIEEAQ